MASTTTTGYGGGGGAGYYDTGGAVIARGAAATPNYTNPYAANGSVGFSDYYDYAPDYITATGSTVTNTTPGQGGKDATAGQAGTVILKW